MISKQSHDSTHLILRSSVVPREDILSSTCQSKQMENHDNDSVAKSYSSDILVQSLAFYSLNCMKPVVKNTIHKRTCMIDNFTTNINERTKRHAHKVGSHGTTLVP